MGCIPFSFDGGWGHIHVPDHVVNLEPFGAKVWCEFSRSLGPAFFRSERSTLEIAKPSKKTWEAFSKWVATIEE